MKTLPAACAFLLVLSTPLVASAADPATFDLAWGTYGTGDGEFRRPYHVAVGPNGHVYVADAYNARVQEFTGTGGFVRAWGAPGSGPGQFQMPVGVATDLSGNVYVTDNVANRVQKFTADGTYLAQWDAPDGLDHPLGICSDQYGKLYVADREKHRIVEFLGDGTYVGQIGSFGTGPGQLAYPSDVAAGADGVIAVADEGNSRIEKFTSGGGYLFAWGTRGSGPGQFVGPLGIAVDSYGNVHVADTDNHRIQSFTASGELRAAWGSPGSATGHFRRPSGVAAGAGHEVYVADSENHRVQKFTLAFPPLAPGPCNATQGDPDAVVVSWTNVENEAGYRIYRSSVLIATTGPDVTSFVDNPAGGQYTYCVEAFNAVGSSVPCCAGGGIPPLSAPSPCSAGDNRVTDVPVVWANVLGEQGYRVYRNGQLLTTTPPDQTSYADVPPLGEHTYCIEAFRGSENSPPCCDKGSLKGGPFPSPSPCNATDNIVENVTFSWSDIVGEDGYRIYRDAELIATTAAGQWNYRDVPPTGGPHAYCVQAFQGATTSPLCCDSGECGVVGAGSVRLSWNSCEPQRVDTTFSAAGPYKLVISAVGVVGAHNAHDTELFIGPRPPDAWRFDAGGCQPDGRLGITTNAFDSGCPALTGPNPLAITGYGYDPDAAAAKLRLAIAYDQTTADPQQRYTLWQITFDHSSSIAGADGDPATCNGAEVPLDINVSSQILLSTGANQVLGLSPTDKPATWNGGTRVSTRKMTWGRVKALYR